MPVGIAAVAEYMVAELLELAGNACRDSGSESVAAIHMVMAMKTDDELVGLFLFVFTHSDLVVLSRRLCSLNCTEALKLSSNPLSPLYIQPSLFQEMPLWKLIRPPEAPSTCCCPSTSSLTPATSFPSAKPPCLGRRMSRPMAFTSLEPSQASLRRPQRYRVHRSLFLFLATAHFIRLRFLFATGWRCRVCTICSEHWQHSLPPGRPWPAVLQRFWQLAGH